MTVYQVNLIIEPEIFNEFRTWLTKHVEEMLQFPGFKNADIQQTLEQTCRITVTYSVESQQHLQDYFDNHADRMRQDGLDHFGERFSASRRIFEI